MKKIIIADDHQLFRAGLKLFLEQNNFTILAEANSTVQLKKVATHYPQTDIFLLDCQMPQEGPLAMIKWLRSNLSEAKTIFLTGLQTGSLFRQLLAAKADGIVSKNSSVEIILEAIETVQQNKTFVSEDIQALLPDSQNSLSVKESQVLELILQGKSNRQIGEILFNAERTINIHRTSIMRKLNVHSIVELIEVTRKKGFYQN